MLLTVAGGTLFVLPSIFAKNLLEKHIETISIRKADLEKITEIVESFSEICLIIMSSSQCKKICAAILNRDRKKIETKILVWV